MWGGGGRGLQDGIVLKWKSTKEGKYKQK